MNTMLLSPRPRSTVTRSRTSVWLLLLIPTIIFLTVFQVSSRREDLKEDAEKLERANHEEYSHFVLNANEDTLDSDAQVERFCTCTLIGGTSSPDPQNTHRGISKLSSEEPTIFLITPTYTRATQMPDMTRLAQTLMLVPNVFWIVVEDSHSYSKPVRDLLHRSKVPFAHLLGPRPITHLDKRSGRGVSNRLRALKYLRDQFTNSSKQGVLYFADDDNAYDVRIFDEIRYTRKVSVFPVGSLALLGVSTPILNRTTNKVIGFHDPFLKARTFAMDMAGFAVNLQYFLEKPKAYMPYKVGYEEDFFLKSLDTQMSELEPLAKNCTEVLVWHTKTQPAVFPQYSYLKEGEKEGTNLGLLYDSVLNNKL